MLAMVLSRLSRFLPIVAVALVVLAIFKDFLGLVSVGVSTLLIFSSACAAAGITLIGLSSGRFGGRVSSESSADISSASGEIRLKKRQDQN